MGMFDVAGAANVQVRKSGQYLQAGIHTVKFVGVEKNDSYSAIDFSFENENGTHTERLFEPQSNVRQANRFNSAVEDPSQAEQFMCKLMQIIEVLNPEFHAKMKADPKKYSAPSFDKLIELVKMILEPKIGTETQIKLLPNGRFVGFPGFPARIDRNGNLYLSTSFIGSDLTLTAYEKNQIDKALTAKPTKMETFDLGGNNELLGMSDELGDVAEEKTADSEDDGLPF